jgi:large subunit ribosomal protein L21
MYAVVSTSGGQIKCETGDTVTVDRVDAQVGSTIELDQVLFISADGRKKAKIGAPTVKGAKIIAEIMSHDLGEKRETYRYRRTRSYRKTRGFRPSETTLQIKEISV